MIGLIIAAVSAAIVISGCGIKKPPVPPSAETPRPVNDLTWKISENTLALRWTIPRLSKKEQYLTFMVYRSATALTSPACADCPKLFEKAGDIPIMDSGNDKEPAKALFQEKLNKGYRYAYMVKGVTEKGVQGPDSNIVTFDF